MASSSTEMTHCNTSDAFFLRPFLTREEFAYWNSHFYRVPSSRSVTHASNPKDTTTVTSDQHMTSCVRNATGIPCCDGRHTSGVAAVHGCCSNARSGEMPCFPEIIASSIATSRETMNAKVPGKCFYSTTTSIKENASLDKGYPGNPSSLEHLVPSTSQAGQTGNHLDISTNCCDTREGYLVQQEAEPTKLKGRYLYGDESFGKRPPPVPSSGHQEVNSKTGSAVLSDSVSAYGVHSELGSTYSFPAKRKSISPSSEHDNFPQRKGKRQCVGDDVNGIQQNQPPSEIVHRNETWKAYQSKPPQISGCCSKDARCKIKESRDMRRSREITVPPVQDCLEQNINATTSGASTSGAGCKPGSNTFKETQPITIDLTENNSDAALKSRVPQVGDQIPNGRNNSLERKNIDEVIKSTKPVQRKLMTNDRTGGCAFDHDSMPRLIGVLSPSAIATVMSSLGK